MSNYVLGAVLELKDKAFSSNVKESSSATGKLKDELEKTGKQSGDFGNKLKGAGKKAAIGIAAIGTTAIGMGTAAFAATLKVAGGLDEIGIKSAKLGITTDAFQEMKYWAEQNGVATSQLERGVGRLNQRMGKAANGNEKYASALENLGVSMDDVKNGTISTEDAFATTLQTLSEMTNEQDKSALASELYGTKLARDLLPALQDGSLSMEDAKKKAHELGLVIGEDSIDAATKFQNTWDRLKGSVSMFGIKALAGVMPFFQKVMDFGIDKLPAIQSVFSSTFKGIGTVASWLGEKGKYVFDKIKDAVMDNQPTLEGLKNYYLDIWQKTKDLYEVSKPVFTWLGEEGIPIVVEAVAELVQRGLDIYNVIVDNWSEIGPFVIGIATAFGVWKAATITHAAVTELMAKAQWGLNVAMDANPIGLVIVGIGLLIGIGITLYKNWDKIKAKALSLWETIDEKFPWIKKTIVGALKPVLSFFSRLKQKWDDFKNAISNFKMPKIGMPKWLGGKGVIQGSHATGLRRVPYDGYVAELHKDEAVLPKSEAERYRKTDVTNNNSTTSTTNNNTDSKSNNNVININVDAKDKSPEQFADEFVPILKTRLENI